MAQYLFKRILLVVPTLFGIMLINFIIIQFAPGGPMEQAIAQMTGLGNMSTTASVSSAGSMGQPSSTAPNRTAATPAGSRPRITA